MLQKVMQTPTVVACLSQYMSLRDLFALAAVDRYFYQTWSTQQRIVDALQLRERVKECINRDYKRRNPFLMLRKEVGKGFKNLQFRCFGPCGKKQSIKWMVNRRIFPLPRCSMCTKQVRSTTPRPGYKTGSLFEFSNLHWLKTRFYFKPDQNKEVLVL